MPRCRLRLFPLVLALALPAPGAAQDPGLVEALAPILMMEDRRHPDPAALAQALEHPDPQVRRAAVVAIGRIGQRDYAPFLVQRLQDHDQGVLADAFFAMGLLREPRTVAPILDRLRAGDSLDAAALTEAAMALARIGGPAAAGALADIIGGGGGDIARERRDAMRPAAMLESWRLGAAAPVQALLPFATAPEVEVRWRALYVLGRIAAPEVGDLLLQALRDRVPLIREAAARSLSRRMADTAGLGHATVLGELGRAADDPEPGVRINALGAIATFRDSSTAERIAPLLNDPDRNVRVAAAEALGAAGGSAAVEALESVFAMRDAGWALERAALASLAQRDTVALARHLGRWLTARDAYTRAHGFQLLGRAQGGEDATFRAGVADADPRVRAAALAAWAAARPSREAAVAAARTALRDADPLVRQTAIRAIDPAASIADLDLLLALWPAGDLATREAILQQVARAARGNDGFLAALADPARRAIFDRPPEGELRAIAQRSAPVLAARWGPVAPIETGRTLEDYRGIVRTLVFARENPRVVIEVEGRGNVEVELLPREAPLTVANFLRLVDRRYFDGNHWHRVVPNFVVQDGDPTGLGSGGPGWSIRDEINRRQYDTPMLGMALSGPDTGGSQWFINLSPQPHLNGQYTIFGRVTGSYGPLKRILQGDVIRTIRR